MDAADGRVIAEDHTPRLEPASEDRTDAQGRPSSKRLSIPMAWAWYVSAADLNKARVPLAAREVKLHGGSTAGMPRHGYRTMFASMLSVAAAARSFPTGSLRASMYKELGSHTEPSGSASK